MWIASLVLFNLLLIITAALALNITQRLLVCYPKLLYQAWRREYLEFEISLSWVRTCCQRVLVEMSRILAGDAGSFRYSSNLQQAGNMDRRHCASCLKQDFSAISPSQLRQDASGDTQVVISAGSGSAKPRRSIIVIF